MYLLRSLSADLKFLYKAVSLHCFFDLSSFYLLFYFDVHRFELHNLRSGCLMPSLEGKAEIQKMCVTSLSHMASARAGPKAQVS